MEVKKVMLVINTAIEMEFELYKIGDEYFLDNWGGNQKVAAETVAEYFSDGTWRLK